MIWSCTIYYYSVCNVCFSVCIFNFNHIITFLFLLILFSLLLSHLVEQQIAMMYAKCEIWESHHDDYSVLFKNRIANEIHTEWAWAYIVANEKHEKRDHLCPMRTKFLIHVYCSANVSFLFSSFLLNLNTINTYTTHIIRTLECVNGHKYVPAKISLNFWKYRHTVWWLYS